MGTNCPNCGAPIKPGTAQCEYCGTWCKEEPKEAEPTRAVTELHCAPILSPISPYITNYGQVNIANGNAIIGSHNGQICSTADAIRQAQNQQHDCNTAEWLRIQAEQCQNALPYRPAPRPVCKKPERERKPFENGGAAQMFCLFCVIVAIVFFLMGAIVPFIECDGPKSSIIIGKVLSAFVFFLIGVIFAALARAFQK